MGKCHFPPTVICCSGTGLSALHGSLLPSLLLVSAVFVSFYYQVFFNYFLFLDRKSGVRQSLAIVPQNMFTRLYKRTPCGLVHSSQPLYALRSGWCSAHGLPLFCFTSALIPHPQLSCPQTPQRYFRFYLWGQPLLIVMLACLVARANRAVMIFASLQCAQAALLHSIALSSLFAPHSKP